MLAAWGDLPGTSSFKPFIGAGLGAVRTRIGETHMTFSRTPVVLGWRQAGFGWMLTARVVKALGERITLDLAWRYMDLGTVRIGRGGCGVVWRDTSREPLLLDLAETRAKPANHGYRLSLRYAF